MASRYFPEPTCENSKYPCGICAKTVSQRHKAIQCDSCNYWNHVKCDQISDKTYESLQKSEEPHYCQICKEQNVISTFLTTENEDSQSSKVIKNTVVEKVYHCGTCKKKVGQRHRAVQCDLCDCWNHIKCDGIDAKTYDNLKKIK